MRFAMKDDNGLNSFYSVAQTALCDVRLEGHESSGVLNSKNVASFTMLGSPEVFISTRQ